MYSYNDVEKIKINLEWIVHHASAKQHWPNTRDSEALRHFQELIQIYEELLLSIKEFGIYVIDDNVTKGLSSTERLIAKIKLKMGPL